LQEFRARVRKTATSGNVTTYSLQLWEGGVQRAVLGTGTVTATNPGVVLAGTWDAATLADPSGAGVECRVQQTGGGANGGGSSRRRIEVGAVEWNATYSTTVAVAPASATHGHTATAPSLTQTHAVSPGSGSHAHTATEPVVTAVGGSAVVTPASAGHAHAATAPAVSQRHAVAPASATHTHAAGSPPLSQTHAVGPESADHAHAAGSPTVAATGQQSVSVSPDSATSGHGTSEPELWTVIPPAGSQTGGFAVNLTTAQMQTIKADIAANANTVLIQGVPTAIGAVPHTSDAAAAVADWYNQSASPTFTVWRTSVSNADCVKCTTWVDFIALGQGQRDAWQFMLSSGRLDASDPNVRAGVSAIFGVGTATTTALLAVAKRSATNAEKLMATGTGTVGNPGTMVVEGGLTGTNVDDAWNLA
jgi:hypothetical protein